MRFLQSGMCVVVFASMTCDVRADAEQVRKQLADYYMTAKAPAAWARALTKLENGAAKEKTAAATLLRDLLEQSLRDELSGKAPWRSTPFWGGGGENPAQGFREIVVKALMRSRLSVESLPVLRWFMMTGRTPGRAVKAAQVLCRLKGKEADAMLAELAAGPHPNVQVAVRALQEAKTRKLPLKVEQLRKLALHHRRPIRQSARAAAKAIGIPIAVKFDAVVAMKSASVGKLMGEMKGLIVESAPVAAKFVVVTTQSYQDGKPDFLPATDRGWLLREKNGRFAIFTPFGKVKSFRKHTKPMRDEEDSFPYPFTCTYKVVPMAAEIQRVTGVRTKGARRFELSEDGPLSGQFEGRGAGPYELMLAEWLYRSKRYDLAAKILFPALDTLYEDRYAVGILRDHLGHVYGCRMLVAFVGDRDYEEALKWATLINQKFRGVRFHGYAKELSSQLPRRGADFKTLKLPTPKRWQALKKTLNRQQQIAHLCRRMRLLNAYQGGQPGSVHFRYQQTAEPNGLSQNATRCLYRGKTEVVNPLVELAALNLKVSDISAIAPFLRENWFVLAVGFWRDFHPSRTLKQSRPLLADVINNLAFRDICASKRLDAMSKQDVEKQIQSVIRWAKDNASKTEKTLLLDALQFEYKANTRWYDVEDRANRLAELKVAAAIPTLRAYFKMSSTTDYVIADILYCCRRIDARSVSKEARQYLNARFDSIRLEAALILWQLDKSKQAGKVISNILSTSTDKSIVGKRLRIAVDSLFDEGSAESHALAAKVFKCASLRTPHWEFSWQRPPIARRFHEAKLPQGYQFYLKLIEGATKSDAEQFARELYQEVAPNDAELERLLKMAKGKKAGEAEAAVKWLRGRIRATQARKSEKK